MKHIKKVLPPWVLISLLAALTLTVLLPIARSSHALADFVNAYIATPIRAFMAALTHLIPISLFELILLLLLPSLVILIVALVRERSSAECKLRRIFSAVGVVAVLYCGYVTVMSIPYNTTPLAERLDIEEDKDISRDELYSALLIVRDRVNGLAEELDAASPTKMPYTVDEMSRIISREYGEVRKQYPFFHNFDSRVKPVHFSSIMSDMGITGIYTYFTGEANVNTCYPDYTFVFTSAHEMAHQRGINRENEANFMAFFVLSQSDDAFLRYSAYLNMYEYLAYALYPTDPEGYYEIMQGLDSRAAADIKEASRVTREHRDSPLYKLMNDVNDAYLKSNGTEGVVSYGYVVRLAVGYLLR